MNDYVVYTMPLAKYLQAKGFMWKRIGQNKKDQKRCVFYFENTSELVNTVKHYKEEKSNDR